MNVRRLLAAACTAGLVLALPGGRTMAARQVAPAVSAELQRTFQQLTGSDGAAREAAYDALAKSKAVANMVSPNSAA